MKNDTPAEPRTLLVIEDDRGIRESLELGLGFEDYTVLSAATGSEGLRLLREHAVDALILDVLLPDLKVTEVYVFTGPRPKGKRGEVRALLGSGDASFARLTLDPRTFEPVPLGLAGFLPSAKAPPQAASKVLAAIVPAELSLSSVVVPEPQGYKLLLVYQGWAVGELKLGLDLLPAPQKKWLEEAERSR